MLRGEPAERQLIDQFLETLRALPEVRAEVEPRPPTAPALDKGYAAKVDLQVAGNSVTLLIEARKALYPRDVRQALWQLKNYGRRRPEDPNDREAVSLLIADSISPGAKEMLRDELVGYYDSGGSLFLPARGILLYIDRPPPAPLSKSMRTLFSGRRAQVLHTLLVRHENWFGVKELAEQAQVSAPTASQVLTELERFDWLASRGQGPNKERHLREPASLLDAWTKQLAAMRPPAVRRYYVPSMRTDQLVEQVDRTFAAHGAEYAVTHEAAGQRYAPFLSSVSQVRCRLLVGSAADHAMGALRARGVTEGANLALIDVESPGELLFRERVGEVWLASPVQVYLDLVRGEGRSKELAEHLRRERIGF